MRVQGAGVTPHAKRVMTFPHDRVPRAPFCLVGYLVAQVLNTFGNECFRPTRDPALVPTHTRGDRHPTRPSTGPTTWKWRVVAASSCRGRLGQQTDHRDRDGGDRSANGVGPTHARSGVDRIVHTAIGDCRERLRRVTGARPDAVAHDRSGEGPVLDERPVAPAGRPSGPPDPRQT
jgi:hypothetical protein